MATRLDLQIKNGQLLLAPGDSAEITLLLTNTSEIVDAYEVTVNGLDPRWYELSSSEVRLFPKQQATVSLKVHLPQGGMSTLAGMHVFTATAVGRDNPTGRAIVQGTISIAAAGGLALGLDPKRASGRRGYYGVTVANLGNGPRSFVLTLTDPEEALHYSLGAPLESKAPPSNAQPGGIPSPYGPEGPPAAPSAFSGATLRSSRHLEQSFDLPANTRVTIPLQVKPEAGNWFGRERVLPFQAGIHPPGVEWEAQDAQVATAEFAHRPIFAFLAGWPLGLRRALALVIPLLILGLLLFLLLRPQGNAGDVAANQTALALSQTRTAEALAAGLSQTMTAVAQQNPGNQAATNATLTALAQNGGLGSSAALTAQAQATTNAALVNTAAGAANIDRFFLVVGTPGTDGRRPDSEIGYDVTGAADVKIASRSRAPSVSGLSGLDNLTMIDYTMIATGTNGRPITGSLSVLVFMPPSITQFSAAPDTINAGESTILSWNTKGATQVLIDDIPVTANPDGTGSISVSPSGPRRFIMCAQNSVGMNCRSLLVNVLAPGQPSPTAAPPTSTSAPVPTRQPTDTRPPVSTRTATFTPVPTTAVPVVPSTPCAEDYSIEREESATPIPAGALVRGSQCADCTVNVQIPFNFRLYNRVFEAVNVGANGTLSFATNSSPASNTFFDNDTLNYSILPHWDNLSTVGAGNGIFTRVDGTAPERALTIGFRGRYASDGSPISFDVRLFEDAPDQRIEVIYNTVTQLGRSASVGVQRDTEAHRSVYEFDENGSLRPGYKVIFRLTCGQSVQCTTGGKVYVDREAILPSELLIERGSSVEWFNASGGAVTLNATGDSGLSWNSSIAAGGRYSRLFNDVASYTYTSSSNPDARGTIRVVESCRGTLTPTPPATATPRVPGPTPPASATATSPFTGTPIRTATATGTATRTSTTSPTTTSTASTTRLVPTVPPSGFCPGAQAFVGSLKVDDSLQLGRIAADGEPSTCAVPTSCGVVSDGVPRPYDVYTFTNVTGSEQCVTVKLDAPNCIRADAVMSVAYRGAFNPANVCANYLGSSGQPAPSSEYSFLVPNGTTIEIVVNAVERGGTCSNYTLQVSICVPPTPEPRVPPPTRTPTATNTSTHTATFTTTSSPTATVTRTPTRTSTASSTATVTSTVTSTATASSTATVTVTATSTVTSTATSTASLTPTITATICPLVTYTYTVPIPGTMFTATNLVPGSNCDDCLAPITLPFPVQIYNETFTTARAGSNGELQFASNTITPDNVCLPDDSYDHTIFALWDDHDTTFEGNLNGIYTNTIGVAPNRLFVVRWEASNKSGLAIFEVVFTEGADYFDLIYGPNIDERSATIGIQEDYFNYTQLACNSLNLVLDGRRTRFSRLCQTGSPSPTVSPTTTAIAGTCPRYFSQTPVPIPVGGVYSSTISITQPGTITDLDVIGLNLTKGSGSSYFSVSLRSPANTVVSLTDWVCPSPTPGSYNMTNVNFDDEAAGPFNNCQQDTTGSYRPQSPLSAFDGTQQSGTWTLSIENVGNGQGQLTGWGLQICTLTGTATATRTATQVTSVTPTTLVLIQSSPTSSATATQNLPSATATTTATPRAADPTEPPPTGTPTSVRQQPPTPTSTLEPPAPTPTSDPASQTPCRVFQVSDLEQRFGIDGTLNSVLTVPRNGIMRSVRVLDVGLEAPTERPLGASLRSPSGAIMVLPEGCAESRNHKEWGWRASLLATGGNQPVDCSSESATAPFDVQKWADQIRGMQAGGDWTLALSTGSPRVAGFGELQSWALEVCYASDRTAPIMVAGVFGSGEWPVEPLELLLIGTFVAATLPAVRAARTRATARKLD